MYGMVNEGIRTFIVNAHDEGTWASICRAANIDQQSFERMASYDDAVTYKLVGAICEHTGRRPQDVLEIFGKYWINFAGGSNFGELMRLAGRNFVERVQGLDDMHDRILLSMPHLKPPSFEIEAAGNATYLLRYYSDRAGLAPMVIGLLHGLAADTDERIEVHHLRSKSDTLDHDVFEIRLLD